MIEEYYSKLKIDAEVSKEFETNIGKELKKWQLKEHWIQF